MSAAPSLYSLCIRTISAQIIDGCQYMQELFELPSDFIDSLIMELPPLGLQNLHELSLDSCGMKEFITNNTNDARKRGRINNFNNAWKSLYKKRWPEARENGCLDWQQLYWESHIQNCLDDAAEKAFLPASDGHIGGLIITDSILSSVGFNGNGVQGWSTLSYQCQKFGHYARCLRLHKVLCSETCELLRTSKLQELTFRKITSKTHVDGVCMLLNRNRNSLTSLEFIYCIFSHDTLNQICSSVYKDGTKSHGIVHLRFKLSFIFESKASCIPMGFQSFLLSGRLLKSLHFCDTHMSPKLAKLIMCILLDSSCGLVNLEISDSDIAGWLSNVDRNSVEFPLSLEPDISWKSLTVLSLKGNNLGKDDARELSNVLYHMPNLRSIDISKNPIKDDGIRSLIPYFIKAREKTFPISDIKMDNCGLSDGGVSEFLKGLPVCNEPLNNLSIAKNGLGSSIAPALVECLSVSCIKILNIEDIGLGPSGFQELEKCLHEKLELVNINISKNRGGMEIAYFISKLIFCGPNLASIDARFNFMPPESLVVIHDTLKISTGKLQRIILTGNAYLYYSRNKSAILEFQYHGKPIIALPSPHSSILILPSLRVCMILMIWMMILSIALRIYSHFREFVF